MHSFFLTLDLKLAAPEKEVNVPMEEEKA